MQAKQQLQGQQQMTKSIMIKITTIAPAAPATAKRIVCKLLKAASSPEKEEQEEFEICLKFSRIKYH